MTSNITKKVINDLIESEPKTNKMKAYYIKTSEARLLSNVVKHAVNRMLITIWCLIIGLIPLIITAVNNS